MKLEMRVWDLDIKVELEDSKGNNDQLEVLSQIKELVDTLTQYDHVNVSIVQVEDNEEVVEQDEDKYRFSTDEHMPLAA